MEENNKTKDFHPPKNINHLDSHLQEILIKDQEHIEKTNSHPVDVAEQIEQLPFNEQLDLVKSMSPDDAAEALAELDEEHAGDVLESLTVNEAAAIVNEMSPDDAVDVLYDMEEDQRENILDQLPHEDAEELRSLLSFDSEIAAGIMNTEMVLLPYNSTADDIIYQIRENIDEIETAYYAYLVDEHDILCHVVSMRDLMRLPRNQKLSEILKNQEIQSVPYDMPQKDVAHLFAKYNYHSMPVVDREGRVLGIITHDDIIDIINDEASADMLGMVGAGQDEDIDTYWFDSVKMRLPWLLVNLCTSSLAAFVVYLFDGTISQMAVLAVLMPLVANQSGNTGQQALAVMIRQLAVESFNRKRTIKAVFREIKIGICVSLFFAILAFLGISFIFKNYDLALVMAGALIIDMILGASVGASIPLILRALGRDPAQASSIFLTAVTDSIGFFVFLGLASIFLL